VSYTVVVRNISGAIDIHWSLHLSLLQALSNFGVSKVIDSTHPDYHAGDLVWGMTGWEEYTHIAQPASLIKINHPELPLSYYTGVLGELSSSSMYLCAQWQCCIM
jgi:NADPH-dependent curcumin reductase CurA